MKYVKSTDAFPMESRTVDGHSRRARTITCDQCGFGAHLLENSAGSLPPDVVAKKFIARGWKVSGSRICPRCQAGKKPMSPAARRAAFCAINDVERKPPENNVMSAAPAVRIATAEERRRIREALEDHYDEDAGRYRSSFSDKALAAKLDVPLKWVADLRDACGYGPDRSEATDQRNAEIETLKLEIAKLQADLIERFDELERRCNKLQNTGAR